MMLKVEELNEKIDLITDDLNNKIELIIHQNEKIIRDLSSLKLTLPSDALARVEKYLSGELSFEEDKPKKFNKSKSNSKRKDVRKSNPKPPTLRN